MEWLLSHNQMFLLFHSRYVSAQIRLHREVREKYINNDEIYVKLQC
jgi:hypothetical protein